MTPGRTTRRTKGLRWLLALTAVLLLLWWAAPRLLEAYAGWFIVEDSFTRADAAVALSGGEGERLHAAIQLYRKGRAGCILITGPDAPFLKVYSGEDSLTQGEAKRRIAVRKGIPPDSALLALGSNSTWQEAQRTLEEARARSWRSIVVVTDPFHTRRTRATFHKIFRQSGIQVAVYHLPMERSSQKVERWWSRESDTMAILTETIKTVFYLYNHKVWP